MPIVIEKGVPMPRQAAGGGTIYPLRQMLIGDSFVVPKRDDITIDKHQSSISSILWAFQRRHVGYRFATRRETKDGQQVVRVWRVQLPSNMLDQNPPPAPPERSARVHLLDDARPRRRA